MHFVLFPHGERGNQRVDYAERCSQGIDKGSHVAFRHKLCICIGTDRGGQAVRNTDHARPAVAGIMQRLDGPLGIAREADADDGVLFFLS